MEEKIKRFAALVQDHTLTRLIATHGTSVNWARYAETTIKPGRKYTKVDVGNSGKYMIDEVGGIFFIKGYGVINKKKQYGTLDTIDDYFWGEYYPTLITIK